MDSVGEKTTTDKDDKHIEYIYSSQKAYRISIDTYKKLMAKDINKYNNILYMNIECNDLSGKKNKIRFIPPKKIKSLSFELNKNITVDVIILKNKINRLSICSNNGGIINIVKIPQNVKNLSIVMYHAYDHENYTDAQIKSCNICNNYNKSIKSLSLPNSLKYISIHLYKYTILPILPSRLKTIVLSGEFNAPLPKLPNTIRSLYLDKCYNYNQPLNELPPFIRILTLGIGFCQVLDNLPQSLRYIKYYCSYVPSFPASVSHIVVDSRCEEYYLPPLLESLISINICARLKEPLLSLPKNLKNFYYNGDYSINYPPFPQNIKTISINICNCDNIIHLSPKLKSIKVIIFYGSNEDNTFSIYSTRDVAKIFNSHFSYDVLYLHKLVIDEGCPLGSRGGNYKNIDNNMKKLIYNEYSIYVILNLIPFLKYILYNKTFIPFEIYNYIYEKYDISIL